MSCLQTLAGLSRDCLANMGGVKRVYIANRDDVASITVTSGKITAITMVSSKKFYQYDFRQESASMESSWQVNVQNGSVYVHTALTLLFHKMTTTKRVEVMALALGELAVIVEDNNGAYWYMGYDNPVFIDGGGDSGTGTAFADANRYGIVLADNSLELPMEVLDTIIAGLL